MDSFMQWWGQFESEQEFSFGSNSALAKQVAERAWNAGKADLRSQVNRILHGQRAQHDQGEAKKKEEAPQLCDLPQGVNPSMPIVQGPFGPVNCTCGHYAVLTAPPAPIGPGMSPAEYEDVGRRITQEIGDTVGRAVSAVQGKRP